MNDFFNTLGIEATKEEKKIKKAYRARLHAVNPEDDPDGFKRLREAYEEALKYAVTDLGPFPVNTPDKRKTSQKIFLRQRNLFPGANSFTKIFIGELTSRSGKSFFQKISVSA